MSPKARKKLTHNVKSTVLLFLVNCYSRQTENLTSIFMPRLLFTTGENCLPHESRFSQKYIFTNYIDFKSLSFLISESMISLQFLNT